MAAASSSGRTEGHVWEYRAVGLGIRNKGSGFIRNKGLRIRISSLGRAGLLPNVPAVLRHEMPPKP